MPSEITVTVSRSGRSSPPPPKPTPLPPLTIVLTPEQHRALVEKFALPFGASVEDAALFLHTQSMAAPEPARAWMIAKTRAAGKSQQPAGDNAFDAHAAVIREHALAEVAPALAVAAALAEFTRTSK